MLNSEIVFSQLLKVDKPFAVDATSGNFVISRSFRHKLISLQNTLDVPESGLVDDATLALCEQLIAYEGPGILTSPTLPAAARRLRRSQ